MTQTQVEEVEFTAATKAKWTRRYPASERECDV